MIESMNGRDVEALLRSMISYLQVRNIRLDDSKPVSYGNTHDESYGCVSYGIGVQEFVERPDDDFSSTDVMYAVVALGHEVCGHGCQIQHEFYNKDKVLSKVLALNYYACAGSPYYYGVLDDGTLVNADNYFRQPYEIAAQYAGIKSAYLFLEHKFDKETADELVCRYVESRIEKDSEFIDSMPQERTADAVLEAFDDAFKHAVTAHRDYSPSKAGEDIVRIASRTMGVKNLPFCVEYAVSGVKQDAILAGAYISTFDFSHTIRELPVFEDVNLDLKSLCRIAEKPVKPMPKGRNLTLQDLEMLEAIQPRASDGYDDEYV